MNNTKLAGLVGNRAGAVLQFASPFLPIVVLFFVYPIPPITDLIPHIAFTLMPTSAPDGFYITTSGITYRTFDLTARLLQWIVGADLHRICAAVMLLTFGLLFSAPVLFVYFSRPRALRFLPCLAGPAFLMMHSLFFVWGAFPFIFSAWLSALAALAFLRADHALLTGAARFRWSVLSYLLLILALCAHPLAFFYCGLALFFMAARLVFNRRSLRPRLAFFSGLTLAFLLLLSGVRLQLGHSGSLALFFGNPDILGRLRLVTSGAPYDIRPLIPYASIPSWLTATLSVMPLLCFAVLVASLCLAWRRGSADCYSLLVLWLLAAGLSVMMLSPDSYGAPMLLTQIPYRHLTYVVPLSLIVLADSIGKQYKHLEAHTVLLTAGSVIICSICVGLFWSPYKRAQAMPNFADLAADGLERAAVEIKESRGIRGPVVIKYYPSKLGRPEFQFRTVPFLLLANKELTARQIWIEHEWVRLKHLPIRVNPGYDRQDHSRTLYWDPRPFPNIDLQLIEESTAVRDAEITPYTGKMLAEREPEKVVSFLEDRIERINWTRAPFALHHYALALHLLGRPEEALVWYDRAVEVNKRYHLVVYRRGHLHSSMGRTNLACRDFRKALSLNPSYEAARAAVQRVCKEN